MSVPPRRAFWHLLDRDQIIIYSLGVVLLGVAAFRDVAPRWAAPSPLRTLDGQQPIRYQIDLNRAVAAELDLLPGIGPKTAAEIVEYRDRHGLFRQLEDLRQVPRMSRDRVEKLRGWVTVGQLGPGRRTAAMKPRTVIGLAATAVALASLVFAGRELARRFSSRLDLVDLLFPALAVATALITIGIVDWVRNLDLRTSAPGVGGEGEDEAAGAPRYSAPPADESLLCSTMQALERLANDELGAEKTIEEALKAVGGFANAAAVTLWVIDEQGQARLRARLAEGQVALDPDPAAEPTDSESLRLAAEHRKVFEAMDSERASFLVPLVSAERCTGILKVGVPLAGSEEERSRAAQKLSQDLAQIARPLARALRAPGLYEQAVADALTGLYSKRHFINRLTEATGASRRYGEPLSLILMDVDNFSLINRSYGQATGDRLLQTLGSLVRENTREVDTAYRYGADEMAIILADTDVDRALVLAERLRRAARASRTLADNGTNVIATVSLGVAEFDEEMRGIGSLISRAEEALYAAKAAGRDRVERWREAAAVPPAGTHEGQ